MDTQTASVPAAAHLEGLGSHAFDVHGDDRELAWQPGATGWARLLDRAAFVERAIGLSQATGCTGWIGGYLGCCGRPPLAGALGLAIMAPGQAVRLLPTRTQESNPRHGARPDAGARHAMRSASGQVQGSR